jgi:hypothetical protein
VRNGHSITTIPSDPDRCRKPARPESRPPLHAVTAEHDADSTVVRVDLGPSEWALAVQPSGLQPLRSPPGRAGPFIRPLPRRFALVRVPGPADPRLGPAVLLYRRGHTLICCPQDDITERAARVLSALAGQALDLVLGGTLEGTGHPEPHMTVTRIEHSLLPADHRHVASAKVRGCDIVFVVCSGLISARLADVLGPLCTAHARDLLQLSRPCPGILAATGR